MTNAELIAIRKLIMLVLGVSILRIALKEIVIQNIADFQQQIGVNPFAAEHFVDILTRVVELCGQPSDAAPLPSQFSLDEFPYVRFFVHRFAFERSLARWANKKAELPFMLIS